MKIVIATRKSELALWQARFIKARIEEIEPSVKVELLPMSTRGDKILDVPLAKIGGKGLFLKELEQAILKGEADIAVHSMKDVPMEFPSGLQLSAICSREDPSDAFVSNRFERFDDLPKGASVGTSSLRRKAQLAFVRPDLNFIELRGNVNTRLSKLDAGEYDAIILASAGLIRLGFADRIQHALTYEQSLPAGGQGAVGVESRCDDEIINHLLAKINDQDTACCVMAERALNTKLMGGCQVPIAAHAQLYKGILTIDARVADIQGTRILRSQKSGQANEAWTIGEAAALDLLSQGAQQLLDTVLEQQ